MSMLVRELTPDDWPVRRDVRLAALLDAPYAFASTYAQTSGRSEAEWRAWPRGGALFGAWLHGRPVGMVGVDSERGPDTGYVFAMWVEPAARGTGVADALLDAVTGWARARGLAGLLLEVARDNDVAARFYRRRGFARSDDATMTEDGTSMRLAF
jgi:ribosomal protein S18 acetylase RimI-like enzyme